MSRIAFTKDEFPGKKPSFPFYDWRKPDYGIDFCASPIFMYQEESAAPNGDCIFSVLNPYDGSTSVPKDAPLQEKTAHFFNYIRLSFSGKVEPVNQPWNFLNPYYLHIEGARVKRDTPISEIKDWQTYPHDLYAGLYPAQVRGNGARYAPGFWTQDPMKDVSFENNRVYFHDAMEEFFGFPMYDEMVVLKVSVIQLFRVLTFGSVDMVQNINTWHLEDYYGRIIKLSTNDGRRIKVTAEEVRNGIATYFPYVGEEIMRKTDVAVVDNSFFFPKMYGRFGECRNRCVGDQLVCVYGEDRIAPKTNYCEMSDLDRLYYETNDMGEGETK